MQTITRTEFDQHVAERVEEVTDETDWTGWFCIATAPFPCPAEGCDFVAGHLTGAHLIYVWPEKDDRDLLHHAQLCVRAGRDPRIVEYEPGMGPCIPYYVHQEIGRPVHGVAPRPEGWPT
jgi:hypothetical protein